MRTLDLADVMNSSMTMREKIDIKIELINLAVNGYKHIRNVKLNQRYVSRIDSPRWIGIFAETQKWGRVKTSSVATSLHNKKPENFNAVLDINYPHLYRLNVSKDTKTNFNISKQWLLLLSDSESDFTGYLPKIGQDTMDSFWDENLSLVCSNTVFDIGAIRKDMLDLRKRNYMSSHNPTIKVEISHGQESFKIPRKLIEALNFNNSIFGYRPFKMSTPEKHEFKGKQIRDLGNIKLRSHVNNAPSNFVFAGSLRQGETFRADWVGYTYEYMRVRPKVHDGKITMKDGSILAVNLGTGTIRTFSPTLRVVKTNVNITSINV